jgi:hypothetical protein
MFDLHDLAVKTTSFDARFSSVKAMADQIEQMGITIESYQKVCFLHKKCSLI